MKDWHAEYLAQATHFWVGFNVKTHWDLALEAAKRDDHLAVHTWCDRAPGVSEDALTSPRSHPHLTTYTDEEILGELGWTMQIIYDLSGHLPKYVRPPFGDTGVLAFQ
jgi:peptidoglycan/xylan/chitin deacetylase (PgdA/CDA1 family)